MDTRLKLLLAFIAVNLLLLIGLLAYYLFFRLEPLPEDKKPVLQLIEESRVEEREPEDPVLETLTEGVLLYEREAYAEAKQRFDEAKTLLAQRAAAAGEADGERSSLAGWSEKLPPVLQHLDLDEIYRDLTYLEMLRSLETPSQAVEVHSGP